MQAQTGQTDLFKPRARSRALVHLSLWGCPGCPSAFADVCECTWGGGIGAKSSIGGVPPFQVRSLTLIPPPQVRSQTSVNARGPVGLPRVLRCALQGFPEGLSSDFRTSASVRTPSLSDHAPRSDSEDLGTRPPLSCPMRWGKPRRRTLSCTLGQTPAPSVSCQPLRWGKPRRHRDARDAVGASPGAHC